MTPQQLARATGARIDRATEWLPHIEAAMAEFDINTPARQAAFLAQIGHESGGLHWLVEIWGPTDAQRRYEGRADLGNTQPGDGFKYRGRGLIQTTGRANYQATGDALGVDLVSQPELLGQPELAARSAGWFWTVGAGLRLSPRALGHGLQHGCNLNDVADADDFMGVTLAINGGTNGYQDRLALFEAARGVLA